MNNLDTHIDNVVNGLAANLCVSPSHDTRRAVRIMVQSMFNWSRANDIGAVGFQVQQMILMMQPDDDQCIPVVVLGGICDLFTAELAAHHEDCRLQQLTRRNELRQKMRLSVTNPLG